ncbi:AH receptor-interacting protein-like [Convolutriloba macropyga]|uniref:AH receptor-interacting protein-like n=1 Tax=Convolutriloba macropyga TaxID=536237 RepID=UPI003F5274F5
MNDNSCIAGVVQRMIRNGNRKDSVIRGTKFIFHFQAFKLIEEKRILLDDSQSWNRPMELIFGHQFKLEIWETLLARMRIGEISEFDCLFYLVMNYPKVASQLRKIMVEGTHAEPESHCCGASMQKFSVGYDDLDELISNPPKYLTFRIELIDALSPNSYERETWTMSEDEKLSRILFLKESGNEDFRNNKLDKATDKYYEAVALLDQLLLKEKPGSKEHDKLSDIRCPILLNYCQCCLEKDEFYKVIKHTSEVLDHQPDNPKAFFKRAKANKAVHNFKEAIEDMEKVVQLDATLTSTANKFFDSIKKIQSRNDKSDEQIFKNMLKIS